MNRTISFGLSVKEVQAAIKEVKEYQKSLDYQCEELCRRLTAEGILLAKTHIGSSGFGKHIRLSSEITPNQAGCKAILYMEDISKIVSEWQTLEGTKSAVVSPTLMIEFGSGLKARNPKGIQGVGKGTFPGQTHAEQGSWWYMDLDGEWHNSTGVSPKMPMYNAGKELKEKIISIAKAIFKD